jgi:hypothetical protein
MAAYVDLSAYKCAEENARSLLRTVLPTGAWKRFENRRVILVKGKRNIYVLSPVSQTQIREKSNGRLVGRGCLQLSVPAPNCDRLVAEYLILKNDEDLYWKTANIFPQDGWDTGIPLMIVVNIVLLLHLFLEILHDL